MRQSNPASRPTAIKTERCTSFSLTMLALTTATEFREMECRAKFFNKCETMAPSAPLK